MTESLISFGTNLTQGDADVRTTLVKVLTDLTTIPNTILIQKSRNYDTPAWPIGSGPDFVNAAFRIRSSISPSKLLAELHRIERKHGRERTKRWGVRTCDLDLLMYGDQVRPDARTIRQLMAQTDEDAAREWPETLTLPHPRMHRRAFVLLPLMDIAPDWRHPLLEKTVRQLVSELPADTLAGISAREEAEDEDPPYSTE